MDHTQYVHPDTRARLAMLFRASKKANSSEVKPMSQSFRAEEGVSNDCNRRPEEKPSVSN
jgi:hypothetical protein